MSTIFFSSHRAKSYKNEQWRHIFSQWYCSSQPFIGKEAIYDLSDFILKDDWDNLIINKQFWLREQWMMYLKALVFAKNEHRTENLTTSNQIIQTNDPAIIKALGRTIKGYDDNIWNDCRFKVVVNGNYLEFTQNKEMKDILMGTCNRQIVESAPKDAIWGIGFNESDARKTDESKWGLNLLGKSIMEVRTYLQQQQQQQQ